MKKVKIMNETKNEKMKKMTKNAQRETTLRPPLRRRCAMVEPLTPIRNCGGTVKNHGARTSLRDGRLFARPLELCEARGSVRHGWVLDPEVVVRLHIDDVTGGGRGTEPWYGTAAAILEARGRLLGIGGDSGGHRLPCFVGSHHKEAAPTRSAAPSGRCRISPTNVACGRSAQYGLDGPHARHVEGLADTRGAGWRQDEPDVAMCLSEGHELVAGLARCKP